MTGLFLALVMALNAAKTQFINESIMAEEMGGKDLLPYGDRCAILFCTAYANQALAAGLPLNSAISDALLELQIPEEVMMAPFKDLPFRYSFHPRRGIEQVGPTRLAS